MEKTYKRMPFDIELAKKIQSREIKGKIVCRTGCHARILCTDFKDKDEIFTVAVAIEENCLQEKLVRVRTDGTYSAYESDMDLFIELPEETPKHKFKVGDLVRHKDGENHTGVIYEIIGIERNVATLQNIFKTTFTRPLDVLELVEDKKQHEFKPFDKVLVREDDGQVWHCDFYSYTDNVHEIHYCVGHYGEQILPYEGNEHLVGTTDKPE